MRAGGGCSVQQSLTPEAATVVRQAVTLARRRGHAQVTPLHVASAMLSSSAGLLRAACLRSHSHPLQCKALELCFNVALNRLPASTFSSPSLHHHLHLGIPTLSNALVAAFKRSQAHQRRGSVDPQQQPPPPPPPPPSQQPPLLSVKIELEQLVVSILDDPSVSRVMREAGFSSTQVKSNVELAVSADTCPSSASPPPPPPPYPPLPKSEDVTTVVDALATATRRSVVVVGECLASEEAVVRAVMERVEKADEVPEVLRNSQIVPLPLSSFRHMALEEVDEKVGELRCLAASCFEERRVVLWLKDLGWAAEYRARRGEKGLRGFYCPLEHLIMEIRSLLCGGFGGGNGNGRLWLLGSATYQTYMRCRVGNPSLETLWNLQPLTIPSGSLGLSLNCGSQVTDSQKRGEVQFLPTAEDDIKSRQFCSADYSINFETDRHGSIASNLPSWLRQCKKENRRAITDDQDCFQLKGLCRKWNSICSSSAHKPHSQPPEVTFNISTISPTSSIISIQQPWPLPLEPKHPWNEHLPLEETPTTSDQEHVLPRTRSSRFHFFDQTSIPNSTSSSSGTTDQMESHPRFKELNAANLKTLCSALESKFAGMHDFIPEIASVILQCRSGFTARKHKASSWNKKEDTWLLFQGNDTQGKERMARELARVVFGSPTDFTTVGLSKFTSSQFDSTAETRSKRQRTEASDGYIEGLFEAARENPHRVIMMGDVAQVDYSTRAGIKRSIERGRIRSCSGEEVGLCDAIVILSCERLDARSRACSPPAVKPKGETVEEETEEKEVGACLSLDLNLCAAGDHRDDDDLFDDGWLVESVDRVFFFRLPEGVQ